MQRSARSGVLTIIGASSSATRLLGEINRFDWRPLKGFVLAIPPFHFYSIGGNLATAPTMVGHVLLWKPSRSVLLANYRIMQVLQKAGLPEGVINFVPFDRQYLVDGPT